MSPPFMRHASTVCAYFAGTVANISPGLILGALLLFVGILACSAPGHATDGGQTRILVLVSHGTKQFEEALEGFRENLPKSGVSANIEVIAIDGDPSKAGAAIEKARKEPISLIFSLGSVATDAAKKADMNIPVVAGLVLDAEEMKGNANITGVTLAVPIETQMQWIAKLLPEARNIGIIFSSARNAEVAESASRLARNFGLGFFTHKVEKPTEIPDALESLSRKVDALFGIPDDIVYTPQTAKHILLFSLKNRMPFIGISEAWVKAGALYSLDCDYRDLGAQCSEVACAILKGRKTGTIPPAPPRKVVYSINLKTAAHMKIDIPESILQGAHEVFR